MGSAQPVFAHPQPATSVSATKVFPDGLRPPAIAKSLAETTETAGMGAELRIGRDGSAEMSAFLENVHLPRSRSALPPLDPAKAAGSARLGSAAQAATKASWTTSSA